MPSKQVRQNLSRPHLVLEIEIPCVYTADITGDRLLAEFRPEFESESAFILNCIGEPGVVRVRMEIGGEKDSEVVEVWGHVREAKLVEPSRAYGTGMDGDAKLAEHGFRLLRDERACEWCMTSAEALRDD